MIEELIKELYKVIALMKMAGASRKEAELVLKENLKETMSHHPSVNQMSEETFFSEMIKIHNRILDDIYDSNA